jgi:hypothetical protein
MTDRPSAADRPAPGAGRAAFMSPETRFLDLGGPFELETYILIGNTSLTEGTARVTLTFEDSTQAVREFSLPPNSRTNIAVSAEFPESEGTRFGIVVESVGESPAQLIVERATYNDSGGVPWAAGTSALGTRLR